MFFISGKRHEKAEEGELVNNISFTVLCNNKSNSSTSTYLVLNDLPIFLATWSYVSNQLVKQILQFLLTFVMN